MARTGGAALGAGATVLRLPARSASGLVDRLLRGRAWVAFIGVLLAGIVFLNVSLLGLNGEIARTADVAAELRQANSELRLEVAELGSVERIQTLARERGFVMPAPGDVTYLEADGGEDARAAAAALASAAGEQPGATAAAPAGDPAPADTETTEAPSPTAASTPLAEAAPGG